MSSVFSVSISFFSYCRAVKALLSAGADPNLGDEYSNVYTVARERQMNSLHGKKYIYIYIYIYIYRPQR